MRSSSISYTAWLVMLCQLSLYQSTRWGKLVPPEDAQFYHAAYAYCRRHSLFLKFLSAFPAGLWLWLLERALAKGAPLHLVLRKKMIRDRAEALIKQGVKQIVVIGGGFDHRAISLAHQHPDIRCFEIDMPQMQLHKLAIAREAEGSLPANFYSLAADLSQQSLEDVLAGEPAFRKEQPSFFIAEGLVMYLKASAVRQLFAHIRALCAQPEIMFSAIASDDGSVSRLGKLSRNGMLALRGERFMWTIDPKAMNAFLNEAGFRLVKLTEYAELQRPWRLPEEMTSIEGETGEYLVAAIAQLPA